MSALYVGLVIVSGLKNMKKPPSFLRGWLKESHCSEDKDRPKTPTIARKLFTEKPTENYFWLDDGDVV